MDKSDLLRGHVIEQELKLTSDLILDNKFGTLLVILRKNLYHSLFYFFLLQQEGSPILIKLYFYYGYKLNTKNVYFITTNYIKRFYKRIKWLFKYLLLFLLDIIFFNYRK